MDNRGVRSNGGFRMIVPKLRISWDPGCKGMPTVPPYPEHLAVTLGQIMNNAGAMTNGMFTGSGSKAFGCFEVVDNTFATPAVLFLGDYRLTTYVDYAVGASASDTADNFVAAICKIPGFYAFSPIGGIVSVECDYQADDIQFRAAHYGDVVSLGNFNANDGYLNKGTPQAGPPILTT